MFGKKSKRNIYFEFDDNWKYVENETDAIKLLHNVGNFHDGVIESISYVSGSHGTKEGGTMCINTLNNVSVIIAGCWSNTSIFRVELMFEKIKELNLRPAQENFVSLLEGSVFFEKSLICFADEYGIDSVVDYKYTYIVSEKMKYRIASR